MVSKNELKVVKSLKVKKYRAREKRFVVEGAKNVLELLKSEFEVDMILCSQSFFDENQLLERKSRTEIVSGKVLNDVSTQVNNSSCLAVVAMNDRDLSDLNHTKQTFVLDGVNDPGNLGTIIRTLDWFGYDQLVCSHTTADLYNPKTISSTMGSFVRLKVYYSNLREFLKETNLPKYGAQMDGNNLFESSLQSPSVVVMGSESHGISTEVQEYIDHSITIPKYGKAESLNVGIATGLIAGHLRKS